MTDPLRREFAQRDKNVVPIALYFMHYNFCRKHQTLTAANGGIHTTPAMAAGVSDHIWKIEEIVGLLEGGSP